MDATRISRSIYFYPAILAVATLMGTSLYFILPVEPSLMVLAVMSTVCILFSLIFYKSESYFKYMLFSALFCVSATSAAYNIQSIQPHFLNKSHDGQRFWVTGQVVEVSSSATRDKVTLDNVKVYGVNQPLHRIKISTHRGKFSEFKISDFMAAEAILYKPKGASFTGDYNAKKRAFFSNVSATGYVMGDIYKTSWQGGLIPTGYKWQKFRSAITARLLGDYVNLKEGVTQEKAVIAALLTGERSAITKETFDSFRQSGLAHLLAISGLHIGMIGGFVFLLVRLGYAKVVPLLYVRYNKKIAAILAIFAGLFYTMLAGATLPTVRACVMLTLIFMAILAERVHVTLRVLCITLMAILFVSPESVVTASFQLSFCAVTALVLWNTFSANMNTFKSDKSSFFGKGQVYVKNVFSTSLIAGLATMPVAAYHFHEITLAGFLLNILAIPLTAFIIMPLGFLALLTMPFYGDVLILPVMEIGVSWLLWVAKLSENMEILRFTVSSLDALIISIPLIFILLFLLKKNTRYFAVAVVASAVASVIWITSQGVSQLIVVENHVLLKEGHLSYTLINKPAKVRSTRYILSRLGVDPSIIKDKKYIGEHCDTSGCIYKISGVNVFVSNINNYEIVPEDCSLNDVIVIQSGASVGKACDSILIDVSKNGIFEFDTMKFTPYKSSNNRIWKR